MKEIEAMNQRVTKILGEAYHPRLFRPPYGVTTPGLACAIRKTGMQSVGWSLRSLDTTAKKESQLLKTLKAGTRPGAIVLLHDRCLITVNILTQYIEFVRSEGYTFTTL